MVDPSARPGVLVLGMHRSGTSALTRLLSLHGLALPEDRLAGRPDNPLGFFESAAMVQLNDRLLAAAGSAWDDPRPLPDPPLPPAAMEPLIEEAVALLREQWPGQAPFILKDPRCCRLLALWLPALARLGARPVAVLAVRNPVEVARSLAARDAMPRRDALRLWLSHVVAAERDTRGLARAVVHYDDLMRDWRAVLGGLGLGVDPDRAAMADEFLTAALRHHEADTDALLRDPAVPAPIKRVYAELRRAPGESGLDEAVFNAAARSLFLRGMPTGEVAADHAGA
jgi:hypothetical protein